MKISVILARPDGRSFNHAVAQATTEILNANGHEVAFHDLCKEKFPPVLPTREIPRVAPLPRIISRHCKEISNADSIIIIHPNWWGQPPAISKGWVDRVLRPGVAYTFAEGDRGDGVLIGLFKSERSAGIQNVKHT